MFSNCQVTWCDIITIITDAVLHIHLSILSVHCCPNLYPYTCTYVDLLQIQLIICLKMMKNQHLIGYYKEQPSKQHDYNVTIT